MHSNLPELKWQLQIAVLVRGLHHCSFFILKFKPAHVKTVLITYTNSEGSGKPAHPRSLARDFAVRSHDIGNWKKLETKSWRSGPTELLRARVWRNANRTMLRSFFSWVGSLEKRHNQGGSRDFQCVPRRVFEPPHGRTNKMECASSEDSDQPGHSPSLIRVLSVRSVGS